MKSFRIWFWRMVGQNRKAGGIAAARTRAARKREKEMMTTATVPHGQPIHETAFREPV